MGEVRRAERGAEKVWREVRGVVGGSRKGCVVTVRRGRGGGEEHTRRRACLRGPRRP